MIICLYHDVIAILYSYDENCDLLQEHQENILGNTMQSVIALLNNLVACKDSNMKLLYEQGTCFLEFILSLDFCLFVIFLIIHSRDSGSAIQS